MDYIANERFNELKGLLISAPLLVPFCPEKSYRLTTDASQLGLGAVLEQIEGKKVVGVVGYFSKSLQGAEQLPSRWTRIVGYYWKLTALQIPAPRKAIYT